MAFSDVREELNCSICLDVFKDPVTLRCGHNFCFECIDHVLDTQEAYRGYSCPDCRKRIQDRSALYRNITLHNIAEHFLTAEQDPEEDGIFCTYCDFYVPAVMTCLLCEASLCDKHLKKHRNSPEHVLVDPTTSLEDRKCPTHREVLKYYCDEDSTCICVTCCLVGEHKGHKVEPMDDASEKKKMKLRAILDELNSKRWQAKRKLQKLEKNKKKAENRVMEEATRIASFFEELKKQIDDLENAVLCEIDMQEEKISLYFSDLIHQWEIRRDELSKKICSIEELCNSTDSLTVLREHESEVDTIEDPKQVENKDTVQGNNFLCNFGYVDKNLISLTLHSGLTNLVSRVKQEIHVEEAVELTLDINTVSNFVQIEDDLKRAYSTNSQHPDSQERFEDCQVLSTQSFSSGQRFWEVETSKTGNWRVGVAYASIERKGEHAYIGNNNQSWCLCKTSNKQYSVMHDDVTIELPSKCSCHTLVVCLDYKGGRLSFYELDEDVKHLYTFSTTFTQPLHAAFFIWDKWVRIRS